MKNTMRRIASVAGVSAATVSRYINGNEEVSEDLKKKIYAAMETLGCADRVKDTNSKRYLVIMKKLHQPYFLELLRELTENENDQIKLIFVHYEDRKIELIKNMIRKIRCLGLIYFEEEMNGEILKCAREYGLKTVCCGGTTLDQESIVIRVNDIMATYDGTKYLLELGHRKIVFMSDYTQKIGTGFQRLTGCRKAMEEAECPIPEDRILYGEMTYESGYQMMADYLKKTRDFTAVFAFSDEMAMGAITALYDAGIKVPEDVSVLGFDDIPSATHIRPKLSTIHQPVDMFARLTLELLSDEEVVNRSELLLSHQLIKRDSCRALT